VTLSAFCFDATGTLIELAEDVGEVYRRVALDHGVDLPAWRLEDASTRIMRRAGPRGLEGTSIAERRQNETEWWFEHIRQTFQATDSTVRFEDFPAFARSLFDAYRAAEAWRVRPRVVEMLTTFRDQKRPLAVVSNFDHRLPEVLEAVDLSRFFDLVVVPSQYGVAKPGRTLFDAVATHFGVSIETLGYLGDDAPEVLEAIAEHGIRVFDVRAIADLLALPALALSAATLPSEQSIQHD
jgi:putative hydrolase of the HAD superfamily